MVNHKATAVPARREPLLKSVTDRLADPEVGVSLSEIERRRFVAEEKLNEAQLEAVINQNINKFTMMRRIGGKAFDRKRGFSPDVFAGCA